MLVRDVWDKPIVLAIPLLLICYFLYQFLRSPKLPKLPIVGAKPGEWFPLLRAQWRNTVNMQAATELAYSEHKDRACIFPIAGGQNFVHLPYEELQWLIERPDTDVDVLAQIIDSLQLDHTVMDPDLVHKPVHIKLISGLLTREIGNLIPDLLDEIQHSVDELWGTDRDNYKTVCVYDSLRRTVGQVTNRAFVGLPFCRDPALLDAAMAFAQDIPVASTLINLFWPPLRPLVAPLLTLPNRIHTNRFYRILRPEIKRRLKAHNTPGPKPSPAAPAPNDFLQWSIQQAASLPDPYFSRPDTLAGRILIVNFTSIHTSSFAITHAVLDLASADPGHIASLRAEISSVLATHGGRWSKKALAAMPKLDSVMRESARLNSFVTTATNRMVVNPAGITTPQGIHIPAGNVVCTPSFPVFHDPALYPDPDTFRPFRFAEARAAVVPSEGGPEEGGAAATGAGVGTGVGAASHVQRAKHLFATTSPEYTAFGHGRHACAGRFFAASALKVLLAYLVLNYDFEMLPSRPDNVWFATNRIPPLSASVRVVRRREVREEGG
ncbi:hypothetical protein MMC10_001878 [Thelotrema lepadinum]|nr:hypothetical protein [Thelotrema lepadinum]